MITLHIVINLTVDGAEYVEAPFQKYGVMLTQKKLEYSSEGILPMVLFGEKFLCDILSDKEILFTRNIIYPDISDLIEKINVMPCYTWRQSIWTYIVCPLIIYRVNNRNFTLYVLGIRYSDIYKDKNLEGFWGKGKQTFYTRHFIGSRVNGASSKDVHIVVWYFCKQSKEEGVVLLQEISSCEFEIRIFTSRVCSGVNFESTNGHQINCYAEKDAMALVLGNEDRAEPPRYSLSSDFLHSPNNLRGDLFFVINANIGAIDGKSRNEKVSSTTAGYTCGKKSAYRSEEVISASMGITYNFSVDPHNVYGAGGFVWDAASSLNVERFYRRGIFNFLPLHDIVEKVKKILRSLKESKKKDT